MTQNLKFLILMIKIKMIIKILLTINIILIVKLLKILKVKMLNIPIRNSLIILLKRALMLKLQQKSQKHLSLVKKLKNLNQYHLKLSQININKSLYHRMKRTTNNNNQLYFGPQKIIMRIVMFQHILMSLKIKYNKVKIHKFVV